MLSFHKSDFTSPVKSLYHHSFLININCEMLFHELTRISKGLCWSYFQNISFFNDALKTGQCIICLQLNFVRLLQNEQNVVDFKGACGKEWLNWNDKPKHWTFDFLFHQIPEVQTICLKDLLNGFPLNYDVTRLNMHRRNTIWLVVIN